MPEQSSSEPTGEDAIEEDRQAALFATGILDMGGDAELREIVSELATTLQAPAAAVAIVDRERQWFPVASGIPVTQTARYPSLAAIAIQNPAEILIVPDAGQDPRFAEDALVVGEPHARFCAACPIVTVEGVAIGALCAMDPRPREGLDQAERQHMQTLAKRVAETIERSAAKAPSDEGQDWISQRLERAVRRGDDAAVTRLDRVLRILESRSTPHSSRGVLEDWRNGE